MIADKNSDSFSIKRTIMAIASISMTFFSFFIFKVLAASNSISRYLELKIENMEKDSWNGDLK